MTALPIGKIKSVLIVILAALAVYQTGLLWFVNITNRNFLLNYFPFLQQVAIPEGADRIAVPWRIMTLKEDGSFRAQYSNIAGSDTWLYSHMILENLLQDGSFVNTYPPGPYINERMLAWPAYIHEYAFPMDAEWFTHAFGQRGNTLTSRGVEFFRWIIIHLPENSAVSVYFVCENGYVYEFAVTPADGWADAFLHINLEEAAGPIYSFEDGLFIRQDPFPGVKITNPYADDRGNFSLSFMQDRVSGFFGNPAAIRSIGFDPVWVFRDANTVVRYYVTQVLEYINYRAIDLGESSTFLSDYVAAIQFVEEDPSVVNEFYLAGFREENYQHIFYFNYIVGEMPLLMPEGWPQNAPLSYPIVVTVDRGTVIRYRKLVLNFHVDESVRLSSQSSLRGFIRNLLPN